jgi:hypothetical protein
MPYYFFKEHARGSRWELLFALSSFDDAKDKQRDLRRVEKLDGCVVHVVFAETEAEALEQHRKIFNYSEITRVRLTGKHG